MLGKNLTRKVGIAAVAAAVTAVPVTALGTMSARADASDSAKKLCSKTCSIKVDVGAGLIEGKGAKTEIKGANGQYSMRAFRVEPKKGKKGNYELVAAGPVKKVTVKGGKASAAFTVNEIKAPLEAQKFAYVVQPADSKDSKHLVPGGGKNVSSFTVFSHRAAVTGKADGVRRPSGPLTPYDKKSIKPVANKAQSKKPASKEGAIPASIPKPLCRPTTRPSVGPTLVPVDAKRAAAPAPTIVQPTYVPNPTLSPCPSKKVPSTKPSTKPSKKRTATPPTLTGTPLPSSKPTKTNSAKPSKAPSTAPTKSKTPSAAPKPVGKVKAFRLDFGIAADVYAVDLKTAAGWSKVSLGSKNNGRIAANHSGVVLWDADPKGDLPDGTYPVRVYNVKDVANPVYTTEFTKGKKTPGPKPSQTSKPTATSKPSNSAKPSKTAKPAPSKTAEPDPSAPATPKDELTHGPAIPDPTDPAPVEDGPADDAPADQAPGDGAPGEAAPDAPVGNPPIDAGSGDSGPMDGVEVSADSPMGDGGAVVPANDTVPSTEQLSSLPSTGASDLVVPGALGLLALGGGVTLLATRRRS